MTTTNAGIVSMARSQQNQVQQTPETQTASTTSTTAANPTSQQTATPDVQNWYRNSLGRDAQQAGLSYWNGRLQAGEDPNAVYSEFVNSARANGESIRDVGYSNANTYTGATSNNGGTPVDEWGPNVLGRELTAEEVQRYAYDGTAAGAQAAYARFVSDNAGAVRRNMDWSTASQIGRTQLLPHTNEATPMPNVSSPNRAEEYQAAQLGDPTRWNVTADQTVEGRIDNILNGNSPIVQMARTRALQAANDRGTTNSSMAIQAGEAAAYDAAIPIASQDAQTVAKAAGYNADMENQFDVRNVDATNTSRQFNAGAQNTLTGQRLSADTSLATARMSADTQMRTANLSAATQRDIAQLDNNTRMSLGTLDAQTRANIAQLDANTRTQLSTIEANYKNLMQSNASASDLYRQVTQNITNISMNTDMDAAAKQRAVDNQVQLLRNGMQINGAISNLNLGDLLDFTVDATPEAPDAPTPAAPATPTGLPLGSDNFGGA